MQGTGSTVTLFEMLRDRVLTAEQLGTNPPLSDTLGERFWYGIGSPPDAGVVYPFLCGRLINQQKSRERARLRADFEVLVIDRPLAKRLSVETIADRVEGALRGWRDARFGFVLANEPQRDTLPQTPPPGDRELVQVRLVFEIVAYPQLLAQYAVPG